MNKYNKYLYIVPLAMSLFTTSCVDLNLEPQGGTMTEAQKDDVQSKDAAKLESDVVALSALLTQYGSIASWFGSVRHYDYGFASTCVMLDASGMDMPSEETGYNWYNDELMLRDRTPTAPQTYYMWNQFYSHLKKCNDILRLARKDNQDATSKKFRGQALANRAWDYLNLIQIYQFTYKGHEEAPGVPIITEDMTLEEISNNPRAKVKDVYKVIMDDLDEAITLLTKDRSDKSQINIDVAYGLRARANLLMNNWKEAASDAEKAMSGYSPYSRDAVNKPSFNEIDDNSSWMWGNIVTEMNDIVKSGILNFPSMMCSFTGNGYSPGYAGRYINSKLYDAIPNTDVRKGWWALGDPVFDGNDLIGYDFANKCPNVDWSWYITYKGVNYNIAEWLGWQKPYVNVKFGPYKNIYNNTTNACDFPMMRVEEMILIKAEALAQQGLNGEAATALRALMSQRDPQWNKASVTVDDIWFQRRIELWGEGFSFFDIMRLKKPMDRSKANFPSSAAFNLSPESQILLWLIPEDEINQNKAINKEDNNPVVSIPKV